MSNDINDLIKHHVDRHESEVDPQEIWEGILIKQKPKRRFIYFFLPFSLVAIVGLTFFMWSASETQQPYTEVITEQADLEASNAQDVFISQAKAESDITTEPLKRSNTENINKAPLTKNPISEIENELTLINDFAIVNKEISIQNSQRSISKDQNLFQTNPKELAFSLSQSSNNKNQLPLESILINPESSKQASSKLNLATLPFTSHVIRDSKEIILNLPMDLSQQISPLVQQSKSQLKALFLAGVSQSNSSIQSGEAYTARMLYQQQVFSNFFVSTGLSFERLYEKFQWSGQYVIDSEAEGIGLPILDDQGNASVNFGSPGYDEEYYELVEREIYNYNRYEFVDVPLIIGYALELARFRATLSVGTSFNLGNRIAGYRLDSNMVPTDLSSDKFSAGSKYMLGMELNYPFFERLALTGTLNYSRRNFTVMGTRNSTNIFQAGLGLSINL